MIDPSLDPTNTRFIDPNNARYILELERNELVQAKKDWDGKYGTFTFAFMTSLDALAFLTYLFIASVLLYYKKSRTKTNFIVSLWAILNAMVLLENLSSVFATLTGDGTETGKETAHVPQMLAALSRSYGTSLAIVWLFGKCFDKPKPKYDCLMYFLVFGPFLICSGFIAYYFLYNEFIYEVYGPSSDIVNVVVYIVVGFTFLLCKIFTDLRMTSNYTLLLTFVNLITNFPICLMTIYLRFVLDISWVYRFRLYFVDFAINIFNCSNAFIVLFIVLLYNDVIKYNCCKKANKTELMSKAEEAENLCV